MAETNKHHSDRYFKHAIALAKAMAERMGVDPQAQPRTKK